MNYCKVTERLFEIMRLMEEESRKPKDYGSGVLLNHGEVVFLETIARSPAENVSALSDRLGITKGAITHMTGRLCRKELIEAVKREDNKKEKYFRLTPKGELTISGHQLFHSQSNQRICDFIAALDREETDTVFRFLECLRQCVPFCQFQCECGHEHRTDEEETHGQPITAACARAACRA